MMLCGLFMMTLSTPGLLGDSKLHLDAFDFALVSSPYSVLMAVPRLLENPLDDLDLDFVPESLP